jgi:hypothetical protein
MYMYQMSAVDMTTDAALLDEMSSLLDSNLLVLTHTPRGFSPYDDGFKASMFPINLDAFSAGCTGSPLPLDCYSTTTGRTPDASLSDDSIAHKRQIRKEKEALRKQRYQRRLKNERETLRCMAKELPSRLAALQHTRKSKKIGIPPPNWPQRSRLGEMPREKNEPSGDDRRWRERSSQMLSLSRPSTCQPCEGSCRTRRQMRMLECPSPS